MLRDEAHFTNDKHFIAFAAHNSFIGKHSNISIYFNSINKNLPQCINCPITSICVNVNLMVSDA